MNVKFKKFLRTYVINESSIYPEIKGIIRGKTKLQDIYNFLQSEIQSPNNKRGLVISRKQLSIISNWNLKIKKKKGSIKIDLKGNKTKK